MSKYKPSLEEITEHEEEFKRKTSEMT